MKSLLRIALVVLLVTPGYAQKKTLSLNLTKGATYNQATLANITIVQTIQEQDMKIIMSVSGKMTFKVLGFANGLYELEAQYTGMAMKVTAPNGAMEFNSEKNDESDIFSKVLGMMKNKPFTVIMSSDGKVKEVKNSESLLSGAFEKLPQIPEQQKAQLKSQIEQTYGDKAFKGNIESVTAIFPSVPVGKGDKWTNTSITESSMSMKSVANFELKDILDASYAIHTTATLESADKDAYVETNGMSIRYELSGTAEGDILVDKNSGWITEAKITQKISGTSYIKDSPQVPGGMTLPITLNNEMTISNK